MRCKPGITIAVNNGIVVYGENMQGLALYAVSQDGYVRRIPITENDAFTPFFMDYERAIGVFQDTADSTEYRLQQHVMQASATAADNFIKEMEL